MPVIIIRVFYPKAGLSLEAQESRQQLCRSQVFHRKLRNQGCSFTRDLGGAVASRCFPHPTLSSASEQTLKDLKNPRATNVEVRRVDFANWTLRTSPKFNYKGLISVPSGFLIRSKTMISQSPFAPHNARSSALYNFLHSPAISSLSPKYLSKHFILEHP